MQAGFEPGPRRDATLPRAGDQAQERWDTVLAAALDAAIPHSGGRYHAILADEVEDFLELGPIPTGRYAFRAGAGLLSRPVAAATRLEALV